MVVKKLPKMFGQFGDGRFIDGTDLSFTALTRAVPP